jgi:pimeloyl-ACP methyl ester carboxylesterase
MRSVTARPGVLRVRAALPIAALLATVALASSAPAHAQTPCLPGASCGSVAVPLDRKDPSAGTIDIAYALVPHTDARHPARGTIVPNPGGPGQATIGSAGLYLEPFRPLLRRWDVLFIDARGTGQSGALACPDLTSQDPLALDYTLVGRVCGPELGARAGLYGSAAVADDIDAVRTALGIDKLDLWGDSYGTFLMPVYAARHPGHVRSIVLDGAFPIAFDRWGRDVLAGVRQAIRRLCRRTHRCNGQRLLGRIGELARRLRRHPIRYHAHTALGPVRLTLGERELANITVASDPRTYGLLPAAVRAALDHDPALLERLTTVSRVDEVRQFFIDPTLFSATAGEATACHDYPRPYDLAASPSRRRAQYRRRLAALERNRFRPFSPRAWLGTEIDAGPKCLFWPADKNAGSPLGGRSLPHVPVLVQSGDLDGVTPITQGRAAAAQFAHATYGIVANAGHTPDFQPCGVAMAVDFVKRLKTNPNRCRHAGRPPPVIGRPARRAAQLRLPDVHAALPVKRAVAVALATLADERSIAGYSGMTGTLDALRGGTYVVGHGAVRFAGARVVGDAAATGALERAGGIRKARLRLEGRGVRRSRLALRIARGRTHITGRVGGRRVDLRVSA